MATWRKSVHFLHANALAQYYFLQSDFWSTLKCQSVIIEATSRSLQSLVLQQAKRLIMSTQILWDAEVPKAKKASMNLQVVQGLCNSAKFGSQLAHYLRTKYAAIWNDVPSGEKFLRRLLVEGETGSGPK